MKKFNKKISIVLFVLAWVMIGKIAQAEVQLTIMTPAVYFNMNSAEKNKH